MLDKKSFTRNSRLVSQEQFKQVFNQKRRLFSKFYVLYFIHNSLNFPRLGVITSKKNARFAISRNRLRRQAREVFREMQNKLPSVDIVLVANRSSAKATKSELRLCLEKLFAQLHKDCKSS